MQCKYIYQGRVQDFYQGVAEISSGGSENLPEGGGKMAKKCVIMYENVLI